MIGQETTLDKLQNFIVCEYLDKGSVEFTLLVERICVDRAPETSNQQSGAECTAAREYLL